LKVKVKASFESVDFDLAIEILLNNGLNGLNGGNRLGNKWAGGGLSPAGNLE